MAPSAISSYLASSEKADCVESKNGIVFLSAVSRYLVSNRPPRYCQGHPYPFPSAISRYLVSNRWQ